MLLSERRERYRRVLAGDACVYPASVFDPTSARMAESLGYDVGMLAGSIAFGHRAGGAGSRRPHPDRVRRANPPHHARQFPQPDGRRRPRLWQRPQRHAHGRGVGNGRRCGVDDRGHPAAGPRLAAEGEGLISVPEMLGKLRAAVAARPGTPRLSSSAAPARCVTAASTKPSAVCKPIRTPALTPFSSSAPASAPTSRPSTPPRPCR